MKNAHSPPPEEEEHRGKCLLRRLNATRDEGSIRTREIRVCLLHRRLRRGETERPRRAEPMALFRRLIK